MKTLKLLTLASFGLSLLYSCSDDNDGMSEIMKDSRIYATSHSDGNVTMYDLISGDVTTYNTSSTDAEGVYYDPSDDSFTQASRSSLSLESFLDVSIMNGISIDLTTSFSSSSELISPRDIAVNGNIYVVADNADADGDDMTKDGRLFIFTRDSGGFTLRNTVTTNFKVWGIEFVGNDLYTIVDTTNQLAVFTNFVASNTTNAIVMASKTIAIEGIVRTHGLDYHGGTMIMSDIGDAGSDSDGALHVITNFDSKFSSIADGETLALNQQNRIDGAATLLGNPVSLEYDSSTDVIYVAELANGGGRVLGFNSGSNASGNVTPIMNNSLSGVSSLYLYTNN